jgi:hypothetical protein
MIHKKMKKAYTMVSTKGETADLGFGDFLGFWDFLGFFGI